MKNPTDFGKTVATGVDPCLPNCPYYELLKLSQVKVEKLENYCLRFK